MLRKRTLGNKKKSTYTVYSNCNGGSVYFNNNLVGTISSGKLIVELSGADSYTVKIEGGVPSTSTGTSESTDSGSDTSNEYSPSGELRGGGTFWPSEGTLAIQASASLTVMRNTYTQPYTRPKYTSYQTTYSAPGTGVTYGDKTYGSKTLQSSTDVTPKSGSTSTGWVIYEGYRWDRTNTAQSVGDISLIDHSVTGFTKGSTASGVDRSYILLNYTTTDNGYNGSLSVFFNL